MNFTAKEIKNIAVIGHSGEGKTTLCEAMLFNGGTVDRMGKTEDGTALMDFDELEKAKKLSVYTSVAYLLWKGYKINLLDLPGFYDFEGERHEGLAACGGAILVIGANGVLPIGAESVVEYCLKLGKPLIIFINGMDKANADYTGTLNALREKYAGKLAPIQLPVMADGKMTGYLNAIQERCYKFSSQGPQEIAVPDALKDAMEDMQAGLMERRIPSRQIFQRRQAHERGNRPRHKKGHSDGKRNTRNGGQRIAEQGRYKPPRRNNKVYAVRRREKKHPRHRP